MRSRTVHLSRFVPRERQTVKRRQRVHDDDEIGGLQPVHEGFERSLQPQGDRRVRVDVVVVEEEREQSHVLARRFDQPVLAVADGQAAPVFFGLPVQANELRRLDFLWHVILGDQEVGGLQVGDRLLVSAGDRDVHANEIDARAKGGLRRRCIVGALLGARGGDCRHGQRQGKQTTDVRHCGR
jgi:hypothetical protein